MKSAIVSLLIITGSAMVIFSGEKEEPPQNPGKETTGQILTPEISQTQRHILHYEKVITEYKQGKWKLNDRELQMVLMNLSDLYSEEGNKEKSRQYQNELGEHENKHPEIKLREDMRKDTERNIEEHEGKLKEFRQAKRDYRDAYIILRILTADHIRLRQRGKALEYVREMETLKKKHPDLVSDPPRELSEQRKTREEFERKKEEIKKKPFIPKDSRAVIYQYGNKIAAFFQYRIEFYELPEDVGVYFEEEYKELRKPGDPFSPDTGILRFCPNNSVKVISSRRKFDSPEIKVYKCKSERKIKPKNVISFRHRLDHPRFEDIYQRKEVLVCSNPLLGYSGSDQEEKHAIATRLGRYGAYPWVNQNADFEDFYGVVSIDGNVFFQLPLKSEPPNILVRCFFLSPDGRKAVFGVGEKIVEDENEWIGNIREIIIWEHPDRIRKLNSESGNEFKQIGAQYIGAILKKD